MALVKVNTLSGKTEVNSSRKKKKMFLKDGALFIYHPFMSKPINSSFLLKANDQLIAVFFLGLFRIIIHQTHYEKSDWSRAFNQFTLARELDMINAISAADIAFLPFHRIGL